MGAAKLTTLACRAMAHRGKAPLTCKYCTAEVRCSVSNETFADFVDGRFVP